MPAVLRKNTRLYADTGSELIGNVNEATGRGGDDDLIISGHGITKTTEVSEEFGVGQDGFFRVPALMSDCQIPIQTAYFQEPSFALERLAAGSEQTRLLSLIADRDPVDSAAVINWVAGDFVTTGFPQSWANGFVELNVTYMRGGKVYISQGLATDAWRNDAALDTSYGSWDVANGRPAIAVLVTQADNIGATYVLTARIRIGSTNYDMELRRDTDGAMRPQLFIADFNDYDGTPAFPATGTASARVLFTTGGSDVPDSDRTIGVGIGRLWAI